MEPPFASLPRELVTEVFGRVAGSSYTDLYNAKLCCKNFLDAAEEDCILQQISLEHFPAVQWMKKEQVSEFLDKCLRSKNPEALFRKGVVDYFEGNDPNRAIEFLDEASRLGHAAASYALAVVLVLEGGESKKKGIKLLSGMKIYSRIEKQTIEHCRQRLKSIIERVWIKNMAVLDQGRLACCTVHHRRRNSWDCNEDDDCNIVCDGCACDQEIEPIFDVFHQIVH